jgi:hypothetical protein
VRLKSKVESLLTKSLLLVPLSVKAARARVPASGGIVSTTKFPSGFVTAPVVFALLPWLSLMVAPLRAKAVTARSLVSSPDATV